MRPNAPRASVLLVDDVEANLIALEAQLDDMDCDLVRASSGNEALRQLLKREFAIILLDVQMPGMDGMEVAKLARGNPSSRDTPIIFVTAMPGSDDNLLLAYGSGAVDFLNKPINPHVLRSKVRIFLDLYASRRALRDEIAAHEITLAELESFNYSVSHDLRAPLRPLDGFSQALIEEYSAVLDDAGKNYLHRIRAAAQRMSQLIDDLLALSRINQAPLSATDVDLGAMAASIVGDLRRDDPNRHVELVVAPDLVTLGDSRLLLILLENLLRNAWKFTSKAERATIEIGKRTDGEKTTYFVRDDGVGFDPSHAAKLFKPFQRLHSAAQFEGTGIGLAIVGRIVRRHGGQIWAESRVGEGATFSFTLG